jgi:cell division protein FtsB
VFLRYEKGMKKKKRAGLSWLRLSLFLIISVSVFLLLSYPAYKDWREQEILKKKLEAELKEVRAENAKLKEEIEKLHSPDYIEILAREKFGLVKPGEKSYIVIPPKEEQPETTETTPSPPPQKNFWSKVKDFFNRLLRRDTVE